MLGKLNYGIKGFQILDGYANQDQYFVNDVAFYFKASNDNLEWTKSAFNLFVLQLEQRLISKS